jgi:hypothetical protein
MSISQEAIIIKKDTDTILGDLSAIKDILKKKGGKHGRKTKKKHAS